MKNIVFLFILIFVGSVVLAGEKNIPEGVDGFNGTIEGEITKKNDGSLEIKVSAVKNVWKKNTAKNAENLVGKTIVVNGGWHKNEKSGKFEPNQNHINFIKNVSLGKITLEIQTGDGDRFHITELNKEQREIANPEKKKDEPNKDGPKKD